MEIAMGQAAAPGTPRRKWVVAVVIVVVIVVALAVVGLSRSILFPAADCSIYPLKLNSETISPTGTYAGTITTTWNNCSHYNVKFRVTGSGASNTEIPAGIYSEPFTIVPGQTIVVQDEYNPSSSFFSGTHFQLHAINASATEQLLSPMYNFTVP